MNLKEKIQKDLNEALKTKEELKTSVLRMVSAAILNKEKEKRYKLKEEKDTFLTDEEVLDVIFSEAKKRKEAIGLYSARGGSASGGEKEKIENIIKKEKAELEILQKYLPEQLSEENLKTLVEEAIGKTGARDVKDMGKIMGVLMPQIKGKADGNLVSKIVKELLTGSLS